MKFLLLALFVAAVSAVPLPEDDVGPVEMIVNGVPEGEALEISNIVDIKLKEHSNGELIAATNLLHPFTAVGIAEAAAAAESETGIVPEPVVLPSPAVPEVVVPEPVVLPSPAVPEVIPEAVILPSPAVPEVVPQPIILPAPAVPEVFVPEAVVLPSPAVPEVIPEAIVLPSPAVPEVVPEPVVLPSPAVPEVVVEAEEMPVAAPQYPDGEIYNDGQVQVTVNGPESGMLSTLQSWFNMVLNYFNDGVQTSQQIV